jgi:uncharacterized membrane protein
MEAFADCVFGFGLTLLAVQIEVPKRYDELLNDMRGLVVFGFCFAIFFGVWSRHYMFCRRFGLQDGTVRILTAAMLFVLLGYLYPLKYLASVFVTFILKIDVGWNLPASELAKIDIAQLFVIYGIGFAAVQLLFAALYAHAYRMRDKLQLDELEASDARGWVTEQFAYLIVPAVSILIATFASGPLLGWAGYIYFGMGIVGWLHGSAQGKKHRAIESKMLAAGVLDPVKADTEDRLVNS